MPRKPNLKTAIYIDITMVNKLDQQVISDDDRSMYSIILLAPEHKEFPKEWPQQHYATQDEFGRLVGVDQSRVSRLLSAGVLTRGLPWKIWFIQYVSYMKGVAAGGRGVGL